MKPAFAALRRLGVELVSSLWQRTQMIGFGFLSSVFGEVLICLPWGDNGKGYLHPIQRLSCNKTAARSCLCKAHSPSVHKYHLIRGLQFAESSAGSCYSKQLPWPTTHTRRISACRQLATPTDRRGRALRASNF